MSGPNFGWVRPAVVAVAVASGAIASSARADSGSVAVAEVLFRDGRQLLSGKDYDHACPKLAESYRLDPATGTLLALAICHERQGKLASAWGEYSDVASRARTEARRDRERAARSKVAELEPRLSALTIVVPDSVLASGAEIRRNGVVVATAWLGSAVPVDGGTITVDVSLPNKRAWHAEIPMQPSGDRRILTVPESDDRGAAPIGAPGLSPAPPNASLAPPGAVAQAPSTGPPDVEVQVDLATKSPAPGPSEAPAAPSPEPSAVVGATHAGEDPPAPQNAPQPLVTAAIVVGVVGVLGLGLAATSALAAVSRNDASKSWCYGDLCTPAGKQDRRQAVTYGDLATGGFIGGGLLVATGAALFVLGRHPESSPAPARPLSMRVLPMLGPTGVGGVVQGQF